MTNLQNFQNTQDWLGLNIAARLSEGTKDLPHDISERLKIARMQAIAKRKVVKQQVGAASNSNGGGGVATLNFGGESDRSVWNRIASMLPLIALIAGLLMIATAMEDKWTSDIADIDAELLTDDLPPDAYTDPGFAQFLKLKQND
jgi:hypothetical protein